MNYYIDTEFLEGAQTRRILGVRLTKFALLAAFGIAFIGFTLIYAGYKEAAMTLGVVSIVLQLFWGLIKQETPPTIDLISIGIVGEDGREYYAISKDFNLKEAWNRYDLKKGLDGKERLKVYWIRENVLRPIWEELSLRELEDNTEPNNNDFCYKDLQRLINKYGKTNKEIAEEVKKFTYNQSDEDKYNGTYKSNPQFYGYYADYDWVVFCWLFGKMINLPKGFPKYCIDLKQMLDEKADSFTREDFFTAFDFLGKGLPELTLKGKVEHLKKHVRYPKKTNEHNALSDAKWNMELYKFIKSL